MQRASLMLDLAAGDRISAFAVPSARGRALERGGIPSCILGSISQAPHRRNRGYKRNPGPRVSPRKNRQASNRDFRRSAPDYEDLQASKVVPIAVVASNLLL